jgi:hypothetical protein
MSFTSSCSSATLVSQSVARCVGSIIGDTSVVDYPNVAFLLTNLSSAHWRLCVTRGSTWSLIVSFLSAVTREVTGFPQKKQVRLSFVRPFGRVLLGIPLLGFLLLVVRICFLQGGSLRLLPLVPGFFLGTYPLRLGPFVLRFAKRCPTWTRVMWMQP